MNPKPIVKRDADAALRRYVEPQDGAYVEKTIVHANACRLRAFTILTEHNAICTCGAANPKPIVKRGSYRPISITPKGKRELAKIRASRDSGAAK